MKKSHSAAQRAAAGLLFAAMLVLGVMKAQGCQRPIDETAEANPVAPTSQAPAAPTRTATQKANQADAIAEPGAVAEGETSADAGGQDAGKHETGLEALEQPRHMMPATKAGPAPSSLRQQSGYGVRAQGTLRGLGGASESADAGHD